MGSRNTTRPPDKGHGKVAHGRMGPRPELAVAVLADLGLSDERIGRYFRLPPEKIIAIRLQRVLPTVQAHEIPPG